MDSHQEVDSTSASQSSRPTVADTFAYNYDGLRGGIDDRDDKARGDIGECQQS